MFVLLQVHTDTVATGIANVAGNKGACGVSMTLLDNTTIAFVGSHLAARASRVHERNKASVRDQRAPAEVGAR